VYYIWSFKCSSVKQPNYIVSSGSPVFKVNRVLYVIINLRRLTEMKYVATITLVFIACLCSPFTVFTAISSGAGLDLNKLLIEMKKNDSKISNISYIVEYDDFISKNAEKEYIEELKTRGGLTEEKIHQIVCPHKRQIQGWILDSDGRSRAKMIDRQSLNLTGEVISEKAEPFTHSWDGSTSYTYRDRDNTDPRRLDIGVLTNKPNSFLSRQRRVDKLFGGSFVKELEEATATGAIIDVSITHESGEYRISFTDDKYKKVASFDSTKGFSCTSVEWYKDGNILIRKTAKYLQADEGIWYPKTGEKVVYFPNGEEKNRTIVQVKNVKVNDPNVSKAFFPITFPKGTLVLDKNIGLSYTVGEPDSERVIGSGAVSHGLIATEELKDLPGRSIKSIKEIYIPKSDIALKNGIPFVLNLKTGELINIPVDPNTVAAHKLLTAKKKGDIAWNGNLLVLRKAAIDITMNKTIKPKDIKKAKWGTAYDLPKAVSLPHLLYIKTSEKHLYLIKIRKIEANGIKVEYEQVDSSKSVEGRTRK